MGSPNLPGVEADSPSSGESSSEDESLLSQPLDQKQSLHNSSQSPNPAEGGTLETYGFELKEPSEADNLLYERLVGSSNIPLCAMP